MCTLSVSNVIYHKFSHGAAFNTLNGENVNIMLESLIHLLILSELQKLFINVLNINSHVYLFVTVLYVCNAQRQRRKSA